MSTLYDYNDTWGNNNIATGSTLSAGQTFLASATYVLSSVKVKLARSISTDAGTLTLKITTVSSSVPTTTILASATAINQSDLTTLGVIYDIPLLVPILITSGTSYAITLISTSSNPAIVYVYRTIASEYANGNYCTTTNGGSTWSLGGSNIDLLFETWGTDQVPILQGTIQITSMVTGDLYVAGSQSIYGQISITSNISGSLTVTGYIPLTGNINIITDLTGDLFVTGTQQLEGIIYITSELTGTLTGGHRVEWFLSRPEEYDETKVWGYDSTLNIYRWQDSPDILSSSGGRFHQPLVVIGHNCVYYESI